MITIPQRIRELDAAHEELKAEFNLSANLLSNFIILNNDSQPVGFSGYQKNNALNATSDESIDSQSGSGSGAAAAFTGYVLSVTCLLSRLTIEDNIKVALREQVNSRCIEQLSKDEQGISNYHLPIYLSGTLALLAEGVIKLESIGYETIKKGLSELGKRLNKEPKGALSKVGEYSRNEPSAYHTFWAAQAWLTAFRVKELKDKPEIYKEGIEHLHSIRLWSERALSSLIADHHAGVISRFDPVELICSISLATLPLYQAGVEVERNIINLPSDESVRLAIHGLEILFTNYFLGGSLARSRPVYSDERNNSILCSTSEALFCLLCSWQVLELLGMSRGGSYPELNLLRPHVPRLLTSFSNLHRFRKAEGYIPDLNGSYDVQPKPNAFATASAIGFIRILVSIIDDAINDEAKNELHVKRFRHDANLEKLDFPEKLGKIVDHYIVQPLKNGERDTAYYSMILHGPPGTAKTTYSKKLAQMLKWPLLVITQKDFLVDGSHLIDAAADRIFYLVGLIKDVVVLFDELEELFVSREPKQKHAYDMAHTERESRLLTTSMLPRIHDLRDKKRIVFIFATNRVSHFDQAAIRPGRVDIIQMVPPPDTELLGEYLNKTIENAIRHSESELGNGSQEFIESFLSHLKGQEYNVLEQMTFKDIQLFCNELIRQLKAGPKDGKFSIVWATKLISTFESIDRETLKDFKQISETYDRPRSIKA